MVEYGVTVFTAPVPQELNLVSVVLAFAGQTSRNGLHGIGTAFVFVSHRKSVGIHEVLGDLKGTSRSFAPFDEMSFECGF
jgi:hypothetical protein